MRPEHNWTGARAALLLGMLATPLMAGSGTFNAGVYDFCISVRFNATAQQLANIRTAFREGNKVFADATDGQQRLGQNHDRQQQWLLGISRVLDL